MGRRKIEIQPITHERNRSVTFLKRKNGLFKKAYELGVLCSVDVAVIIFDEKPGQHEKLYEYASSDVRDIVKRHIRFSGEKDCRTPHDFSGASATKLDDIGEGDGDDDEEEEEPSSSKSKETNSKASTSRGVPIPAPSPPLHFHGRPRSPGPDKDTSTKDQTSRGRSSHHPNSRKRSHSHLAGRESRSRSHSPSFSGHVQPSLLQQQRAAHTLSGGYTSISNPHTNSNPNFDLFGIASIGARAGASSSSPSSPPPSHMEFGGRNSLAFNALGGLSNMRDIRDLGFNGHSLRDLHGISDLRELRGLGMGNLNFDSIRDSRTFNGVNDFNGFNAFGGGGGSIDLTTLRGMNRVDAINALRSLGVDLGVEGNRDMRDPRDSRNFDPRSPDLDNPNMNPNMNPSLNPAISTRMMYQQMMLHQQHQQQLIQRRERLAALQAAHAHGEPLSPHIHHPSHPTHSHNSIHRHSRSSLPRDPRDLPISSDAFSSRDHDRHDMRRRSSSSTAVGLAGRPITEGLEKDKEKEKAKDDKDKDKNKSKDSDIGDLVAFLDAVENPPSGSRAQDTPGLLRRSSSQSGSTLEWPTTTAREGSGPSTSLNPVSAPNPDSTSSSSAFVSELNLPSGLSNSDTTWLDFLSSAPAPGNALGGLGVPSTSDPSSWSRGPNSGFGSNIAHHSPLGMNLNFRGTDPFGVGNTAAFDRQMLADVFSNLNGTENSAEPGSGSLSRSASGAGPGGSDRTVETSFGGVGSLAGMHAIPTVPNIPNMSSISIPMDLSLDMDMDGMGFGREPAVGGGMGMGRNIDKDEFNDAKTAETLPALKKRRLDKEKEKGKEREKVVVIPDSPASLTDGQGGKGGGGETDDERSGKSQRLKKVKKSKAVKSKFGSEQDRSSKTGAASEREGHGKDKDLKERSGSKIKLPKPEVERERDSGLVQEGKS